MSAVGVTCDHVGRFEGLAAAPVACRLPATQLGVTMRGAARSQHTVAHVSGGGAQGLTHITNRLSVWSNRRESSIPGGGGRGGKALWHSADGTPRVFLG